LNLERLKKNKFWHMARLSQQSQNFPPPPQNKSIKDNLSNKCKGDKTIVRIFFLLFFLFKKTVISFWENCKSINFLLSETFKQYVS